ncbi:hypothetical protein EMCRGX_G024235 [Ephydatia muelleri]
MDSDITYMVFDFKQKFLAKGFYEGGDSYYGKKGMLWWGASVYAKADMPGAANVNKEKENEEDGMVKQLTAEGDDLEWEEGVRKEEDFGKEEGFGEEESDVELKEDIGVRPSPQSAARISALVKPCVDYPLSLKMPLGNFPGSLESAGTDKLVHWCHGAAGVVHMFAHAYRVLGDRKYLDAAVDCGEVVWDRGILRKGYGLCHGVAGNAHTFLQLFRLTTRPEYFNRAVKVCKCVWQMCEGVEIGGMQQQEPSCSTQFAEWCLSSSERKCRVPDHPYSLFEGTTAGNTYCAAMGPVQGTTAGNTYCAAMGPVQGTTAGNTYCAAMGPVQGTTAGNTYCAASMGPVQGTTAGNTYCAAMGPVQGTTAGNTYCDAAMGSVTTTWNTHSDVAMGLYWLSCSW